MLMFCVMWSDTGSGEHCLYSRLHYSYLLNRRRGHPRGELLGARVQYAPDASARKVRLFRLCMCGYFV